MTNMSKFKIGDVVRPRAKALEDYNYWRPWMLRGALVVTSVSDEGLVSFRQDVGAGPQRGFWAAERFELSPLEPVQHVPMPHGDAADRTFGTIFPPPPESRVSCAEFVRNNPEKAHRLVAFWAPAPQSGKTTAANIAATRALQSARISFAAPLRDMIAHFLSMQGVPPERVRNYMTDGRLKEVVIPEVGRSFVELAIFLGTKFGREFIGADVWVEAANRRLSDIRAKTPRSLVVCDDLRFPNELQRWRDIGGVVIGINRPGVQVSAARAAAEGLLSFADCDFVLTNSGTQEEFERDVVSALCAIGAYR